MLLCLFFTFFARAADLPDEVKIGNLTVRLKSGIKKHIKYHLDLLLRNRLSIQKQTPQIRYYLSIIEKILEENGVPKEFKYLALQENNLISGSNHPQTEGYWNLKESLIDELNLVVNDEVDERLNIISTTKAVAKYLKLSNDYFENWMMSLLALDKGLEDAKLFVLKRKIRRSDFRNVSYMIIDEKIPAYIHKFLAHKIYFETILNDQKPIYFQLESYTNGANRTLRQIARKYRKYHINTQDLEKHNRWLKSHKIPSNKVFPVLIPLAWEAFEMPVPYDQEEIVMNNSSTSFNPKNSEADEDKLRKIWLSQIEEDSHKNNEPNPRPREEANIRKNANRHKVVKGQSLFRIARMYGISIEDLRLWNGINPHEDLILEGQLLFVSEPTTTEVSPTKIESYPLLQRGGGNMPLPTFQKHLHQTQMVESLRSSSQSNDTRLIAPKKQLNKPVRRISETDYFKK
jgi:LysM repeat protein